MYTQRGQRRHRMCGVWSPLISDRLDAVTAGHLLYLWRFFFLQRTICLVRGSLSRGGPLICQQTICHCRDLMSPVKTSTTRFFQRDFNDNFLFWRTIARDRIAIDYRSRSSDRYRVKFFSIINYYKNNNEATSIFTFLQKTSFLFFSYRSSSVFDHC